MHKMTVSKRRIMESVQRILTESFAEALETVIGALEKHSTVDYSAIANYLKSAGPQLATRVSELRQFIDDVQKAGGPDETQAAEIAEKRSQLLGLVKKFFYDILDKVDAKSDTTDFSYNIQTYIDKMGDSLVESVDGLEEKMTKSLFLLIPKK